MNRLMRLLCRIFGHRQEYIGGRFGHIGGASFFYMRWGCPRCLHVWEEPGTAPAQIPDSALRSMGVH